MPKQPVWDLPVRLTHWLLAALIAVYTLVDATGVRASGNAASYVSWLIFLEGLPFLLWVLHRRGRSTGFEQRLQLCDPLCDACSSEELKRAVEEREHRVRCGGSRRCRDVSRRGQIHLNAPQRIDVVDLADLARAHQLATNRPAKPSGGCSRGCF